MFRVLPENRKRLRLSRLLCLPILLTSFLATSGLALAQLPSDGSIGQTARGGTTVIGFDSWPIECAMVFVAFTVSAFFFFVVVFRYLLRKNNPVWPITAYGYCASGVIVVTSIAILLVFWEDLVVGQGGAMSFFKEWGGRLAVITIGLILAGAMLSIFRSPNASESKARSAPSKA